MKQLVKELFKQGYSAADIMERLNGCYPRDAIVNALDSLPDTEPVKPVYSGKKKKEDNRFRQSELDPVELPYTIRKEALFR